MNRSRAGSRGIQGQGCAHMVQETPKHILLKIFSSSVIVFCFSLWGLLRHLFFSLLLGFKALGFLLHTAQKQHNLFLISQLLKLHLLALPQWPKFSLPLPQKESLALQFNFFFCPPFLRKCNF